MEKGTIAGHQNPNFGWWSGVSKQRKCTQFIFYDILACWKEKDVITELSKIGKVYHIQIKKQCKYSSVRASILLDKQFMDSFAKISFGVNIGTRFLRWYDGKSTIKEHTERDKWQLTRDLTKEKMDECKMNEYKFWKMW